MTTDNTTTSSRDSGTVPALVRCSIRSRQQEGSCNSCQRRDQEIVILAELRTLSFRVCNRCAKELAEKMTALLSPNNSMSGHHGPDKETT
jgi:predicted amidophosphoribosyltransferase